MSPHPPLSHLHVTVSTIGHIAFFAEKIPAERGRVDQCSAFLSNHTYYILIVYKAVHNEGLSLPCQRQK